jgi:hypothetical protein
MAGGDLKDGFGTRLAPEIFDGDGCDDLAVQLSYEHPACRAPYPARPLRLMPHTP